MTSEERRLVGDCRARKPGAFDELFDRYAGRILAFARRLTGSEAEAEDLTQEALLAVHQGIGRFAGRSSLMTWMLRIVVRRWRDRSRAARIDTLPLEERDDAHSRNGHEPSLERRTVDRVSFDAALAGLDEPLREAFLLVAAQGLTHREAAEVAGVPVGTMKWRVATAAKRLRGALADDDPSDATDRRSDDVPSLHG